MSSVVRQPGSPPYWSEFDLLTDAEVADLAASVAEHVKMAGVEVSAVRELLANWSLAARIKSHPDFEANRAAYRRAIGTD